jgi:transposase
MEALNLWRMRVMATRYSDELRERATRMAVELRKDPATKVGAVERVAKQLGMHPMTLRKWVRQAEVDGGVRPGTSSVDAERMARLEQENKELKRANEILRTASAFFAAAELDRKLK